MDPDYNKIAEKYNLSPTVVQHVAQAIALGHGRQAQFNHPELGGMGQWMPGMIMIGDAFNHTLKAQVDALCHELAQAYQSGTLQSPTSLSQVEVKWWSLDLQNPSISGGQNSIKYVYFQKENRLIIRNNQQELIFDTSPHIITGVSQQQANNQTTLVFHTQSGKTLTQHDLKQVNSN